MGDSGWYQGEIASRQSIRMAIAKKIELAVEDKNALLEGVNCGFGRAARRQ